jgi:hypothetical protein
MRPISIMLQRRGFAAHRLAPLATRLGSRWDQDAGQRGQLPCLLPAVCPNQQRVRNVVGERIEANLETKTSAVGNGDGAYAEQWSRGGNLSWVCQEFRDMNGDLLIVLITRLVCRRRDDIVLDRIEVETTKQFIAWIQIDHRWVPVYDVRT